MSEDKLVLFRRAGRLDRSGLEQFARRLRDEVAEACAFRCLITDDRELQRLNKSFLGKDYATDVLSFPEWDRPPGLSKTGREACPTFLGEVAISAERAAEQARARGHKPAEELRILMLHGVLHLMGMDHEADRGRMARAEKAWRRKLGLPEGLIERSS